MQKKSYEKRGGKIKEKRGREEKERKEAAENLHV
jgi:hypothetical protein